MLINSLSNYFYSCFSSKPSTPKPLVDPTYLNQTYPAAYQRLTRKALPLFNESSASPSDLAILNFLRAIKRNSDRVNESFDEVLAQFKNNPEKCRQILAEAQKLAPGLSEFCEQASEEVNELKPAAPKSWLKMLGVGVFVAAIAIPVIMSGAQTAKHNQLVYDLDMKPEPNDQKENPYGNYDEHPDTEPRHFDCPFATQKTAQRMAAIDAEYQSWIEKNIPPSDKPESNVVQKAGSVRHAMQEYSAITSKRFDQYRLDHEGALVDHRKRCIEESRKRSLENG